MNLLRTLALQIALCLGLCQPTTPILAQSCEALVEGQTRATITLKGTDELRTYHLATTAQLRDNIPPEKNVTFAEAPDHATIRTGNLLFDGLYALAVTEALQNSISEIKDGAYDQGRPIPLQAFQTGELWTYVWTRDLAYSAHLALAGFDPERALNSLRFKASTLKPGLNGRFPHQVIQDTGSGGSYPVSSDRIVWALGASETLKYLPAQQRGEFLRQAYSILHDTLEQDRQLVFDPKDGLYRGEQSFLDWREQSYPGWTSDNVLTIARSKALSVNALNYFALRAAAAYAKSLHLPTDHARYAGWAKELKRAINHHFYDPAAGLYSTYLLTDSACAIRAHRYDLLGESLAILLGVADESQARSILSHYPTGPFGPPVVWPQERTVPIYHNQAIWPFATTYWLKAARQAHHEAAVDHAVASLVRGAAFNLSNMENFDLVTGKPEVKDATLSGPVINSRRQVWSVAGYLAMVQDVL
ncbi:MAG TPA: amylo-alpha-1,6-glucosidase, partial [Candidatus Sulfotelmatobacter sp.]|nr:amylo-alpha-1,6-glucosidase [Candidatus Sulfotelmatobacter sp.]